MIEFNFGDPSQPWVKHVQPEITATDREALDLMEQAGIQVDVADAAPGKDFMTHRDRHGEPDPDSLVLWFLTEYDRDALQELTSHAEDEFGCDWAQIYPIGLRAEWIEGFHATAIPRRDMPAVVDLLRRELAGEFSAPAKAYRQLRFMRIRQWAAAASIGLSLLGTHVEPQDTGMFVVAIILGFITLSLIEIGKARNPAARRSALDWVRAHAATDNGSDSPNPDPGPVKGFLGVLFVLGCLVAVAFTAVSLTTHDARWIGNSIAALLVVLFAHLALPGDNQRSRS